VQFVGCPEFAQGDIDAITAAGGDDDDDDDVCVSVVNPIKCFDL